MGMWVTDPQTGETVWDENAQVLGQATPGAGQRPPSSDPGVSAFTPAQTTPRAQAPGLSLMDFSTGMRNAFTGGAPHNAPSPNGNTPSASTTNPGQTVGADVGSFNPRIDFGSPTDTLPEDQAYLDALAQIQASIGGTPPPQPRELPAAPTYTVDPGLERQAQNAETRNAQMQALFADMRSDVQDRDPEARSKWARFGEFLSAVGASGDLSQAGAIMGQILARDSGMANELRREMHQLTLAGFQAEDALQQAQVNLLSGRHQAGERTQEAAFNRGIADVERRDQYDFNTWEAGNQAVARQSQVGLALAEATRNAAGNARERFEQNATALAGVPTTSGQANRALAAESGVTDPRAQSYLADAATQRQGAAGLYMRIAQTDMSKSRDRNQLLQFLRQWDPTLTTRDVSQDADTQALFLRAIQGRNAANAFRSNPSLMTASQYSDMFSGAE